MAVIIAVKQTYNKGRVMGSRLQISYSIPYSTPNSPNTKISSSDNNSNKMVAPAIVLGIRGAQALFAIIVLGLTAYRTYCSHYMLLNR